MLRNMTLTVTTNNYCKWHRGSEEQRTIQNTKTVDTADVLLTNTDWSLLQNWTKTIVALNWQAWLLLWHHQISLVKPSQWSAQPNLIQVGIHIRTAQFGIGLSSSLSSVYSLLLQRTSRSPRRCMGLVEWIYVSNKFDAKLTCTYYKWAGAAVCFRLSLMTLKLYLHRSTSFSPNFALKWPTSCWFEHWRHSIANCGRMVREM